MTSALPPLLRLAVAPALLAALHLAAPLTAQSLPLWSGEFDEAFRTAERRNVPLVLAIIQDGEEANERAVETVHKSPAFVKAARSAICLVANRSLHASVKDAAGRGVCSKHGSNPCETHIRHEAKIVAEFTDGTIQTPQHIFVTPSREVVERIFDIPGEGEFLVALQKAIRKVGPGLTEEQFVALEKSLAEAAAAMAENRLGEAVKLLLRVKAEAGRSALGREAAAHLAGAEARGQADIVRARESEGRGDVVGALRLLSATATELQGLDAAAAARKELIRMKATPAGRTAHQVIEKEERHRPDLERAVAAEKAGDYAKARDLLVKLADRAKGTAVGDDAAARLARYESDADIRNFLAEADRAARAQVLLVEARKLERAGRAAEALEIHRRILAEFPGTPAAAEARTKVEKP